MKTTKPVVVAGAGSIGCFVGGMLAAAGHPVRFLARRHVIDEININGLRLTSFEGIDLRLPGSSIAVSDDAALLRQASVVLVCVKSSDTDTMAATIAAYAPQLATIVSLQNGVTNVEALNRHVGGRNVLAGVVPFNVIPMGKGRFHRATSGDIIIQNDAAATAAQLSVPGLKMQAADDIVRIQWGKLLVNLNNALNALSDLPLRDQLAQRPWRMLFAEQMTEALAVLSAEGIRPVPTTALPSAWTPHILRFPDWAFRAVAGSMVRIDPNARSSMWDDLQRGRPTEIDYLQGAIIGIARRRGLAVPLTARIVALVKSAEGLRQGSPRLTPHQIRQG